MTSPSWQENRSRLNHDWLKNVYLGGLGALNARLKDSAATNMIYIKRSFSEDLRQWPEKSNEIKDLIAGFEERMSPRVLFSEFPLMNCLPETTAWLPDLVHELWRYRIGAGDLVNAASASFAKVESKYPVCCKALEAYINQINDPHREAALKGVDALRSACENLSRAITMFPSKIEVV